MHALLRELIQGEDGATAIEYSLIGMLVAVACIVAFVRYASSANAMYAYVQSVVDAAVP